MLADMDLYDEVAFEDVPPGAQILPTKMDFKTKYNSLGKFLKDKARLVVLGNLEWETMQDYFSPTAHTKTLNLLLALAVEHNLILYGLDIYGAFITAEINEPVYISLHKGILTKQRRRCMVLNGHLVLSLTLSRLIFCQKATLDP